MSDITKLNNLIELLEWRVERQPENHAYTFLLDGETQEVRMTYQLLAQKAQAIAAWLQERNAAGERALLLYPSGLDYIAAFFGCLHAGVIAVPAYPPRMNRPNPRLEGMVADSQSKFVLTTSQIMDNKDKRLEHFEYLSTLSWLATDQIDLTLASQWQRPIIKPDNLAFLQYTSGSTAMPKGVMVSHGNLLANEEMIRHGFGHDENSNFVGWLPIYHDMGLIGNVLQPMYLGTELVFMSPTAFLQRPFRWLDAISRYQAHTSGGPNFAYDICVEKITDEEKATLDLSSWRNAYNGAEPVRADTLKRFSEAFAPYGFDEKALYPCYGLAEGTLFVTGGRKMTPTITMNVHSDVLQSNRVLTVDETAVEAQTLVSSGISWLDETVKIVNPDTLLECEPDQVGEIWAGGRHIAHGYWQNEEASQETFQAHIANTQEGPFLRTGDLGFMQNGELFVTGRLKDLIIIHGRNYYPQDIEFVITESHPALKQNHTAAFSIAVEGQERLVVVQELDRHHRHADTDEVVKSVRTAVAETFDLPLYAFVLIKPLTIPKTTSGKIQRRACKQQYLSNELTIIADWQMPATPINQSPLPKTVEIPRTKQDIQNWFIYKLNTDLGVAQDQIDLNQSFAYYGLDSARALAMVTELEKWLGQRLNPTVLWNYPTIRGLSDFLASYLNSEPTSNGSKTEQPAKQATSLSELEENLQELSTEEMLAFIQKDLADTRHKS